jgi:hypothetical protein
VAQTTPPDVFWPASREPQQHVKRIGWRLIHVNAPLQIDCQNASQDIW